MAPLNIILCSLITLAGLQATYAVQYEVVNKAENTPGGERFNNEIGIEYSKHMMKSATETIWTLLQLRKPADRKDVQRVILTIEIRMDGISYTSNNHIHLSGTYIADYQGDVKREFTGVLVHEMAHVWQWDGNGEAPQGLVTGIADYVRLKAGYVPPHWGKPGEGERWDQGYDVTAWFLNYCNSLKDGFVAKLNKKMRRGYSDDYFVDLLGKTVDQLWSDYKAKYNN